MDKHVAIVVADRSRCILRECQDGAWRLAWLWQPSSPLRAWLGSGDRRTNRAMRTACALLWCSLRSAIGAANLQDHSESWAAAGLAEQLVQASQLGPS